MGLVALISSAFCKLVIPFATITNDEQFELIFNINADEKYYFDNIENFINITPATKLIK